MKKILLVDDDPLVRQLYQQGLARQGFHVETVSDGLEAVKALRNSRPDLVVLDLMMPKFTGVDVLQFIRAQPGLAEVPVVVFSNSFMNELAARAGKIGVATALLKSSCTPQALGGVINDILAGKSTSVEPSCLLAMPTPATAVPPQVAPPVAPPRPAVAMVPAADEFGAKARREFLDNAPKTCVTIRDLCQGFTNARNEAERDLRLQNLYRKVHFVTATAGLAQCQHIALLASAFEALLFELGAKPVTLAPSVMRTVAFTVDFLSSLFDRARDMTGDVSLSAQALVVDDDPLSNRLVNAALCRAQLQPRSTEDPLVALQWLHESRYDLVLLDIEMPGMNGFELCKRLRSLPGYRRTPVIYVTGHDDFENRAKSLLSGGNDLIAKPVFPMELGVKAVTHLLRSQLAEQKSAG